MKPMGHGPTSGTAMFSDGDARARYDKARRKLRAMHVLFAAVAPPRDAGASQRPQKGGSAAKTPPRS
jgi:hypothetical protein